MLMHMGKKLLHETSAIDVKRVGSKWRAVLITPGQGSSGHYSESVLQESLAAFSAGTKNFFMHPSKPTDQRDPRDQWGFIPENVQYEPGVGVTAEIQVLPHWQEVVDSLAEAGQANLSIWTLGETDEEGNVLALFPDAQNTVDLVAFPGRPGSGLTTKMYESAFAASEQASDRTPSADGKENMDKELSDRLDKLEEAFTAALSEVKTIAESLKPVAPAEGEVDFAAVAEAVVAEESLVPSARKRVFEAVKQGAKVEDALASIKAEAAEYKAAFATGDQAHESGRIGESATEDWSVSL